MQFSKDKRVLKEKRTSTTVLLRSSKLILFISPKTLQKARRLHLPQQHS
jgi:hypothetical protein